MKPSIVLKPLGITIKYSDYAAGERYTSVLLHFSKYDSSIKAKCRNSPYHDVYDKRNYNQIIVWVCRRKLVFKNAALYDNGIKGDMREIEMATEDLISIEDIYQEDKKKQ